MNLWPSQILEQANPCQLHRRLQHSLRKAPLLRAFCLVAACVAAAGTVCGQNRVTLSWDPSPTGGIANYRLYRGGVSGNYTNSTSTAQSTTTTVSNLVVGATCYFAVTAVSTNGLESAFSNEISYTVPAASNPPPTIVLSSPAGGSVYSAPATISLAASVVANNHTISQVQFYSGSTLLGSDGSAPYSFAWNSVPAGTYSLSARLVYDSGSTVVSPAVSVTVNNVTTNSSLTFASTSGSYTAPFTASNGLLSQPAQTTLAASGRAAYNFTISKAGNYLVSAQVIAPSEAQNSFWVNIDAEPTDPLMVWDVYVSPTLGSQTVAWRGNGTSDPANSQYRPKVFYLTQGAHQLIIRGREANTSLGQITIAAKQARIRIRKGYATASAGSSANAAQLPSDSPIVLDVDGQPGMTYSVLTSTNLRIWTSIGSLTVDNTGAGEFTDPSTATASVRYYRVQEP